MNDYFVALEFPSGGSLGFNVEAYGEQDALRKVIKSLPDDMIHLGITYHIVIPKCRINYCDSKGGK